VSAADTVWEAVNTGLAGRRVVLLTGGTGDWILHEGTALRLPEYLAVRAAELGLVAVHYRRGCPPEELVPPGRTPTPNLRLTRETDPAKVLPSLLDLVTSPQLDVMVLCGGVENLLPDAESPVSDPADLDLLDMFQRLPISTEYSFGRSVLVLSEHTAAVHHRLRQSPGVHLCDVPLPDADERRQFLVVTGLCEPARTDEVAAASAGLALDEVRSLGENALARDHGLDAALIGDRKADLLRSVCPNLELLDSPFDLGSMAGMRVFKDHVVRAAARDRLPSMILLVGPPGTGKTTVARALGSTLGRPVLRFIVMNSPYIGENERLQREAQRRIDTMGDVVVWFDEIDQQFTKRDGSLHGDSGTSARVTGGFLEWSGDPSRRNVTIVGATNRPDRLDNAMSSRARLIVPLLHATPRELLELVPAVAAQARLALDPSIDLSTIVRRPELRACSGRHVHGLLERASDMAWDDGRTFIDQRSLERAVASRPAGRNEQDRYWSLLALAYTSDDALLPWSGLERVTEDDVPFLVRDVVDESGALDRERVDAEVAAYARRFG
jgi:hypothetical protein